MSINIFSGGSSGANKKGPVTSSAATRAAATTSALGSGAVASDSGATAVQSNGILGKIGGFLNKVSGVTQHVPGWIGTVSGIVNRLTSANDPEWWNSIPGDGLTCNDPLQVIHVGEYPEDPDLPNLVHPASGENEYIHDLQLANIRPSFLEFACIGEAQEQLSYAIEPTANMIVQYLLPQVRKVINAVYLQDASYYLRALRVQATMYALWRQFKKIDYFLKHGRTYLPNTNDRAFPIFQVANASYLQSVITRLEEYLRANVRLPHTLCEYLAWRFGRVYKINPSAKSAFVMYNVCSLVLDTSTIDTIIANLQTEITNDANIQKAASDIYNAYLDHDQEVSLPDETLVAYDPKEFVLRTNLDIMYGGSSQVDFFSNCIIRNPILMDSELDNPTTFMASTVSCQTTKDMTPLFPVKHAFIYAYLAQAVKTNSNPQFVGPIIGYPARIPDTEQSNTCVEYSPYCLTALIYNKIVSNDAVSFWYRLEVKPGLVTGQSASSEAANPYGGGSPYQGAFTMCWVASQCKAMEFYNVGLYLPFANFKNSNGGQYIVSNFIFAGDITTLSQDEGVVADLILENEQLLAFANLMCEEHRNRTTYRMVEKRVAKDVANVVEQIPLAEVAK